VLVLILLVFFVVIIIVVGSSWRRSDLLRQARRRFIQTALREWAYAKAYQRSDHRGAELPIWLHRLQLAPSPRQYRRQAAHQLGLTGNNLLRLHS